jgi:hypothetical protein
VIDPTRHQRFDAGLPTKKAIRLDNGHLKVPATLGRVGVLEYHEPDGSVRRELRLPEEVFAPESLSSLELVPVTFGHPKTARGFVDSGTTSKHAVGVVGERFDHADNVTLQGVVLVHDAKTIADVEHGIRELSPGYTAQLEHKPGVFNGQPYEFIQRNIRYNHVAIVRAGRAGSSVRLHVDEADEDSMIKIKINGVEFEAPEQTVQAFTAEQGKQASALSAAQAKIDSLDAELKKEREQRLDEATVAQRVREGIDARLKLERTASAILGAGVKLDELDDRAVQEKVIVKVTPSFADKLKDKDATYVAHAFDFAVANHKPVPLALKQARTDSAEGAEPEQRLDYAQAREKYCADQRNAYTKPLSIGVSKETV